VYVLNTMFLRGGKKIIKKEGKLAEYLLLHIFPFDILPNFLPLPHSQDNQKNIIMNGTEEKRK
jgi:hypothetical protein